MSSIWPQLWLYLVNESILTLSEIMYIWMSLTIASLFIGLFMYPWHNLPQDMDKITDDQTFNTVLEVRKTKSESTTLGADGILHQIRTNSSLLLSPIFFIQIIMFAIGNCTVRKAGNVYH